MINKNKIIYYGCCHNFCRHIFYDVNLTYCIRIKARIHFSIQKTIQSANVKQIVSYSLCCGTSRSDRMAWRNNRQHLIPFIPACAHVRIQPVAILEWSSVVKLAWKQVAITRTTWTRLFSGLVAIHPIPPRVLTVLASSFNIWSALVIYERSVWKCTGFIDTHITHANVTCRSCESRVIRLNMYIINMSDLFNCYCYFKSFHFFLYIEQRIFYLFAHYQYIVSAEIIFKFSNIQKKAFLILF